VTVVVITGSTRGLGLGLAEAFLERGCAVMLSGRDQSRLAHGVSELAARFGPDQVDGCVCDVTNPQSVQALWDAAVARFGRVDVWINNAGLAHPSLPVRDLDPALARTVVETNLTGTIYGSQVALRGLVAQGGGQLFNVEGYGSRGELRASPSLAIYGATKSAVCYLSRALALEARGTGVQVGTLSPGMLATDLVTAQYADKPAEWQRAKRILNIFVERVETVSPWLAEHVLANRKNGVAIRWLTPLRLAGYFALAPFRRRDVFGQIGT